MTVKDETPGQRSAPAHGPGRAWPDDTAAVAEFRLALGLYILWAALVTLSVKAGQTEIAPAALVVLGIGVMATNALFFLVARASELHRPPARTVTLAQSMLGITWTTLFAFLSAAPGELVLGMYITAALFAHNRIRGAAFAQLAAFATVSYAVVVLAHHLLESPTQPALGALPGVLTFAAIMGSLMFFRNQTPAPTTEPRASAAPTQAVPGAGEPLPDDYAHRYFLDALEREKGRTERNNYPFAIGLFEIDDYAGLCADLGHETTALILTRLEKRARGELRAMDGLKPGSTRPAINPVSTGRFVVILPQTNVAGATRCAERLRCAIEKFPVDGRFAATVSAGIAEYRRGETIDALLDRCENALVDARLRGGNCVGVRGGPPDNTPARVIRLQPAARRI